MNAEPALDAWDHREAPGRAPHTVLFCLAHAGGSSAAFRGWGRKLPEHIEVRTVELPGHGSRLREDPLDTIATVVEQVGHRIAAVGAPAAVYGHSMGAVIGYETCLWLRRQRLPAPLVLFAGARRAPHLEPMRTPTSHLTDDEFLTSIHGSPLERVFRTPGPQARLLLRTYRADIRLLENYRMRSEPPLATPVVGLLGRADPSVPIEDVRAWQTLTTSFRLRLVDGGHLFTPGPPADLTAALAAELPERAIRV